MNDFDSNRQALTGEASDVEYAAVTIEPFKRWLAEAFVKQRELEATIIGLAAQRTELKAACKVALATLQSIDVGDFENTFGAIETLKAAIDHSDGK